MARKSFKYDPFAPCHVYWVHNETCSGVGVGYTGISSPEQLPRRKAAHLRRWPGSEFTILKTACRYSCQEYEYRLRPNSNIGWNKHPGGGKLRGRFKRRMEAQLAARQAALEPGLLSVEYDFADKVARFSYLAGTEINAPAIKAYCCDLTDDGPPRKIEAYVGSQRIEI